MRKEVIVAIVFGVILGLGVAVFMIFNLRRGETKDAAALNKLAPSPVVKNKAVDLQPLEISEPQDNMIFSENKVKIKGKAPKDSLIIIESPIKDMTFKNDKQDFSVDFPLALGENKITIAAYSAQSKATPQIKTLTIFYLDEQ